jgi:capsular exopolysaccharide synthesis family protein
VLALGAVIGAGSAYAVSQAMTPIYRATATLLVNQTQTPGVIAYNDVLTSERLTKTYRELITQQPVLEDVVDDGDAPAATASEVAAMIHVAVVPDTQLLRLSVEHESPLVARDVANSVADAFIANNEDDGLTRPGTVSVVEPAQLPESPVRPRTMLNTIIGGLAGLLLACVVAVVYEYLDDTVKTPEDAEAAGGLATLGGVPRYSQMRGSPQGLVVAAAQRGPAAEAYRVLRTNLQFSTFDAHTLLITSAGPGEGKSTTTANLAVALAQTGLKVIVVDSDLRRPALHRFFGLSNAAGLTSALVSPATDVNMFLQQTELKDLVMMASGPIPPNPSELLSSSRMDAAIEALKRNADIIVFDSPPVLAVADAAVLAGKVDATILVVDSGKTRAHALRRAADTLARSRTRTVGVVLNKLTARSRGYYYDYGYYYTYASSTNGHNGHSKRRLPWGKRRTTKGTPARA